MKQDVPTGVFVAIIVVVAAVACFFGFRALSPGHHTSAPPGGSYASKMQEMRQKETQSRMSGGQAGGGSYADRMRAMSGGH